MAPPRGKKTDAKHVRIYDAMQGSEAWHHLSGTAVKALLHIASFISPLSTPNGSIFMSHRALAEWLNCDKKTAGKVLRQLVDHGFLRETEKGYFEVKGGPATSYRLTWVPWPGMMGATNEWRKWHPQEEFNGAKKSPRTGGKFPHRTSCEADAEGNYTPVALENPHNCVSHRGGKKGPQILPLGGLRR